MEREVDGPRNKTFLAMQERTKEKETASYTENVKTEPMEVRKKDL
jgi:hypothetical protein